MADSIGPAPMLALAASMPLATSADWPLTTHESLSLSPLVAHRCARRPGSLHPLVDT